jgi:hypothetical protein
MFTSLFLQLFITPMDNNAKKLLDKTEEYIIAHQVKVVTRTYDFAIWGNVNSDFSEFQNVVKSTLADKKGWSRANLSFKSVSKNANFHIILAEGSEIAKYSSGCSATLSCRVGNYILINDTRWSEGSASYNALGLPLSDYRTMVVNHEVGHYLGHSHIKSCTSGPGSPAPVMLQQSTGLAGCAPNPYPLDSELWHRF